MESLQRQHDPGVIRAVASAGGDSSALPSDWFVRHYRAAFPKYAQDREYWPEIEAILRERFLNGGTAKHWTAACNDGKDGFKTPSVFTTIEGYNERVAIEKRVKGNERALAKEGEPIDPEVRAMIADLTERLAIRSERAQGGTPQLQAALALRTLADAREKGIQKDRIVFHTLDQDADAVQGG